MVKKIIISILMMTSLCLSTLSTAKTLARQFPVQITFRTDYHTMGIVENASIGFLVVNPNMLNGTRDGGMFLEQTVTTHLGIGWDGSLETLILIYNGDQTTVDGPENFCIVDVTLDPDTGLLSKADVLRSNPIQPTPADRLKPLYCDVSVKGQEILFNLSCRDKQCDNDDEVTTRA